MNKYRWILLLAMLGFAGTGIETRYLHQVAVTEMAVAWLPTLAALIGAIGCLLAFSPVLKTRVIATLFLLIALAAGPAGVYFHTGFRTSELMRVLYKESDQTLMKTPKGDIAPPAEAPIAFSGLALIALVAASGHWAVKRQAAPPMEPSVDL